MEFFKHHPPPTLPNKQISHSGQFFKASLNLNIISDTVTVETVYGGILVKVDQGPGRVHSLLRAARGLQSTELSEHQPGG